MPFIAKIYDAVCSYTMCSVIKRGNKAVRSGFKRFDILNDFLKILKCSKRKRVKILLFSASGQSGTKVVEFHFENVVSAKRVRLRNSAFGNTFLNYSSFSGKDPCRDGNCNRRYILPLECMCDQLDVRANFANSKTILVW